MPLSLTQYNQAYKIKLRLSLSIAKDIMEIIDNKSCCKNCVTVANITLKMEKEKYQVICNMVSSIFFSSGYFASFKLIKNGVRFEITQMNEEQRIDVMEGVTQDEISEEENPSTPPSC